MPAPRLWSSMGNIRSFIQDYVNRGAQKDSVRRQLNRLGVSTEGVPWSSMWDQSVAEKRNQLLLRNRPSTLIPRPGRDMVGREFKAPFRYRYVVRMQLRDSRGRFVKSTAISIYSDGRLSKGVVEGRAMRQAETLTRQYGWLDRHGATQARSATLMNAYYNEGGTR